MTATPFQPGRDRPGLLQAQVCADTATTPAPSSFSDPLYVFQPHNPDNHKQIADWPADHGNTLPAPGAIVLLARDDLLGLWCLRWTGAHS